MKTGRKLPSVPVGVYLAIYGLALVLPVLAFAALVLDRFSAAEHRRIEARALAAARDLAGELDRELAGIITSLRVLALSPAIARGDLATFDEHARTVAPDAGSRIVLFDDSGASAAAVPGSERWLLDLLLPQAGEIARQDFGFVSDLVVPPDQPAQLVVAVPVTGEAVARSVLAMSFRPDRLRGLLQKADMDDRWRLSIIDSEGTIVVRSHDAAKFEGRPLPGYVKQIRESPESVSRVVGLESIEVYRALARLDLASWRVAVALPVDAVNEPLKSAWRLFMAAGSALLGLSLLLAMIFGSLLAQTIRDVARSARALGRGEPVVLAPSVLNEVNDVGSALETAAKERKEAEEAASIANGRMRLALQAGRMGTFEVDLATGQVESSAERLAIFGIDPEHFDGRQQTLDALIHPDDIDFVQARRAEATEKRSAFESEFRIIRSDGAVRWLLTRAEVRRDASGAANRVFGVTMDITARKVVEKRLSEAATQSARQLQELEALYASAPIGLALFDRELRYVRINAAMAALHGVDQDAHLGRTARQVLGSIADVVEPLLQKVLATGQSLIDIEIEGETPKEPGAHRYFNSHYYPLLDENGILAGVGLIVEEITEDKRAAERQKLLIRELRHRANNMLAVVQSVARRSLSDEGSIATARMTFLERLQALARAHNMLTDSDWRGVSLEELVRMELEGLVDRTDIQGPRIILDSSPAQTFALVLHELAVNAVKHGALSVPNGRVKVTWQIAGAGPDARFRFQWREYGGPPVGQPRHRGFGTELLERSIIEDFDKPARIQFLPDGITFEIDVPYSVVRPR